MLALAVRSLLEVPDLWSYLDSNISSRLRCGSRVFTGRGRKQDWTGTLKMFLKASNL